MAKGADELNKLEQVLVYEDCEVILSTLMKDNDIDLVCAACYLISYSTQQIAKEGKTPEQKLALRRQVSDGILNGKDL